MKVAFHTLGCKVNQYETQAMVEHLTSCGFEIVNTNEPADIIIVNSCTVTSASDKKTRQSVRHYKQKNPNSVVILTGCMPQAYPDDAQNLSQADIVLGNKNNEQLVALIDEYFMSRKRIFDVSQHRSGEKFSKSNISDFSERTRAFIKIQDGCNRFCSYCIIPTARGRSRSKTLDEIKNELVKIQSAGYLEVVLVGINLSAYGRDIGAEFCDAVELACSIDSLERVRLGSLEPDHITPEVIRRLAKLPKLCPQFHISLQSGCDETLKRMNRHYDTKEYRELCNELRVNFPDATLTTDVMVGFPAESDEEFESSLEFVREIGFEKVHVFPYSLRPNTKAVNISPQITKSVKAERSRKLIEVTSEIRNNFLTAQIGKTVDVLLESGSDGIISGYTANYTPVEVVGDKSLCGSIKSVLITGVGNDCCKGNIL